MTATALLSNATALLSKIEATLKSEKSSSSELNSLLAEIATTITEAAKQREQALNPAIPATDQELERVAVLTLTKNRLVASVNLLQTKLVEAEKRERIAVYLEQLEALRPEGELLTQELIAAYPAAEKLIDVLIRLENYNQRRSQLHSGAPAGVTDRLPDPELLARSATEFHSEFKPLSKEVRFVDLKNGKQSYPPKNMDYVQVFQVERPGDRQRYSADWYKSQAEDIARSRQLAAKRLREQKAQDAEDATRFNTRRSHNA
jgi:hypothetical protein